MKKIITVLCLTIIAIALRAQINYYKAIEGLQVTSQTYINATGDGGFAIASALLIGSPNVTGIVLIKFNRCGSVVWSRKYFDTTTSLSCESFKITHSGKYIITGYYGPVNTADVFLLSIDSTGNLDWGKVYSAPQSEYIYSLGENSTGGYFIYGNSSSFGTSSSANFIINTDTNGNITWSKKYFENPIWGRAIACSNGGVLARTGYIYFKTDANGGLTWAKEYFDIYSTSSYTQEPVEVPGGFVYARYPSGGTTTSWMFKIDPSGNITQVGNVFKASSILKTSQLPNGNFLLTGSLKDDSLDRTFLNIVELSPTGTYLRQNLFNYSLLHNFYGYDFCYPENNSVIIAGRQRELNAPYPYIDSLLILKLDTNLEMGCGNRSFNFSQAGPAMSDNSISTTVSDVNFTTQSLNLSVENISITANPVCIQYSPIQVELGNDTAICPGASIVLSPATVGVESYEWQDGSTGHEFTVTDTGTYWLRAGVCDYYVTDTIYVGSSSLSPPTFSLGADTIISPGTSIILSPHVAGPYHYLWQDGSTGTTLTATCPGTYWLRMDGCGHSVSDTITIHFFPEPPFTVYLGRDTVLCPGSTLLLTSGIQSPVAFLWQDGTTGREYTVTNPGTYRLRVQVCSYIDSDTISVTYSTTPAINLISDTTIYIGRSIRLSPGGSPGCTYSWSPASGLSDSHAANPVATPGNNTTYKVTVTDTSGCTATGTVTINVKATTLVIYNTFTPNNDGKNDTWHIDNIELYPKHTVEIYNRNGNLVYRTVDYHLNEWDGKYNGKAVPASAYYYIIDLGNKSELKKGYITIVE